MSNSLRPADNGPAWLDWAQVDVFADAPYQGNMLAIFPDATNLTDAQMQAIARETNLSETTFVFPRDFAIEQEDGIRVRIFTTQEELPFAGHPTLGTASWLRHTRPELAGTDRVSLRLNVGAVPVSFPVNDGTVPAGGIVAEMLQPDPVFLDSIGAGEIRNALRLHTVGLHRALPPQIVSTGLPVLIVPLASLDDLAALRPDPEREKTLRSITPAKFVYFIAPAGDHTWHARLPLYGGEDPATGSAAGCAISYLVAQGAAQPDRTVTILQGQFVQRPSRILVRAGLDTSRVCRVRVRGCTIPVATGRFLHP